MKGFESLQGKIALVTGGGRGIGRAIVEALTEAGASVAFTWLKNRESAQSLEAQTSAIGIQADATDAAAVKSVVAEVISRLGGLDILVINAGIARDRVLWKLEEADWDAVVDTNLKSAFLLIREVAPVFREKSAGRIITVASINGLRGKGGQGAYAASKGGLIALTKSAARELGPKNINVNAVAPGFIETDMTRGLSDEIKQNALRETALGRLGRPEHVAAAVLFLASDLSAHITGQVLNVDAGQLM